MWGQTTKKHFNKYMTLNQPSSLWCCVVIFWRWYSNIRVIWGLRILNSKCIMGLARSFASVFSNFLWWVNVFVVTPVFIFWSLHLYFYCYWQRSVHSIGIQRIHPILTLIGSRLTMRSGDAVRRESKYKNTLKRVFRQSLTLGKPLLKMCRFYMGFAQIALEPPFLSNGQT